MSIDYGSYGPMGAKETSLKYYWSVSTLLLLWGLGYGLLIAESLFIMRPEDFDRLVNAGMILPGYGDYVQHLPQWVVGLTVFKGATRIAGSLGLLLRRRWAVTMYVLSLATSCLIFFRGFLIDSRGSVEGSTQIGLDVVFFCLSVYALYFSITALFRGVLR